MFGARARLAGVLLATATLIACSDAPTTALRSLPRAPSLIVAGTLTNDTPLLGHFIVCVVGTGSTTFDIARTPVGTGFGAGSTGITSTTLNAGQCRVVVNDEAGDQGGSNVAVSETGAGLLQFVGGFFIGINGITPLVGPQSGDTFFINSFHGIVLIFTITQDEPGAEGCTPGYWKQDQHFGNWEVPLTTTFADAGMSFGYTGTLLSGLDANGGGVNALARHAAAAYLNSLTDSGVDFAYTTAEVVAIANGTGLYAGLSIEARKDLLAAANEGVGGCPLGR